MSVRRKEGRKEVHHTASHRTASQHSTLHRIFLASPFEKRKRRKPEKTSQKEGREKGKKEQKERCHLSKHPMHVMHTSTHSDPNSGIRKQAGTHYTTAQRTYQEEVKQPINIQSKAPPFPAGPIHPYSFLCSFQLSTEMIEAADPNSQLPTVCDVCSFCVGNGRGFGKKEKHTTSVS